MTNEYIDIGDLRDFCIWKRCKCVSDLTLMGYGLCDEHYSQYTQLYDKSEVSTILKHAKIKVQKFVELTNKEN
jgi:hypothetical protein